MFAQSALKGSSPMTRKLAITCVLTMLFAALLSTASHAATVCGVAQAAAKNGDLVEMKAPGEKTWSLYGIVNTSLIWIGLIPYPYNFRRDNLPNNVNVLVRLSNGDRKGKIYAISTLDKSQGGNASFGVARIPQLTW